MLSCQAGQNSEHFAAPVRLNDRNRNRLCIG
jgi:hypothetical protein